jgi:hypothetical protein
MPAPHRQGRLTLTNEALLQSVIRHEVRAQLAFKWLRDAESSGAKLKLEERCKLLDTVGVAGTCTRALARRLRRSSV